MADEFFVRCNCKNRRFTGGKSRFLQQQMAEKAFVRWLPMNRRSRGLIPDLDRRLATQRVLLEAVHHVIRSVPVRIVTDFDQIPALLVVGIFVMYCLSSFFCAHVCRSFYNSP